MLSILTFQFKKKWLQSRGFFLILKNKSFIQIYKILIYYIYLYVILFYNRDKIKGNLPKLKTEFFPFLFLQKTYSWHTGGRKCSIKTLADGSVSKGV